MPIPTSDRSSFAYAGRGLVALLLLVLGSHARAVTLTVNSAADPGDGTCDASCTLRDALLAANATPAHDTIAFAIGSGNVTIAVGSQLPTITNPLTIDGLTQPPNVNSIPRVRIDGTGVAGRGFALSAAACTVISCRVSGLVITGFGGDGIQINDGSWLLNTLRVGTDGSTDLGNGGSAISINSSGNLVGSTSATSRNLLSGNAFQGIVVGQNATGNFLIGNDIGVTAFGTTALPNDSSGIRIFGDGTVVGGDTAAHANVISGNAGNGISIDGTASDTVIRGNVIGAVASGTFAIPNDGSGVADYGIDTVIGGSAAGQGNTISGNTFQGIVVGTGATGTVIEGNRIGLRRSDDIALPNTSAGIRVLGATGARIGGTSAGAGNVIAGNAGNGISIDPDADGVTIQGNRIGTDAAGTLDLGNAGSGIATYGAGVSIGGPLAAARNVIAGNDAGGVAIGGDGTVVSGNYIGTTGDGSAAIGNAGSGIRVLAASDVQIVTGNVISGNTGDGISIDPEANGVIVAGNAVGLNAIATAALPNGGSGIASAGAGVVIGGAVAGARNVISGNAFNGIVLSGGPVGTQVLGNHIGTNLAGTAAVANDGIGVRVLDASAALIANNLIAGNGSSGITLESGSQGIQVAGNRIGLNLAGNAAVPNQGSGIGLGGTGNQIGGEGQPGNVISGNVFDGISVFDDPPPTDHVIAGNLIGLNAAGSAAVGNGGYGIRVVNGSNLQIGLPTGGLGNVISGNGRGMSLESVDGGIQIRGNIIGLDLLGNAEIGNEDSSGIDVFGPGVTIGGTGAGDGNVIAGNDSFGIVVRGLEASGTVIEGNRIGVNAADAAKSNRFSGVLVERAYDVRIGGILPGAGNIIRNNEFIGVMLQSGDGISILGNAIADNGFMGIELDPAGPGISDPLDADVGPNFAQNAPVLTSAVQAAGNVVVQGRLASQPSAPFRIEVFHSPACDETGLGEGRTYLGAATVNADASGVTEFGFAVPLAVASGVVSATATAPDGSTSEFSPCHAVGGPNPGTFQIWRDPILAYEGIPTVEVAIVRSHGNAGAASVTFETSDDSATAPADYGTVSTVVDFADGETVKVVEVPVVPDLDTEGQEQFLLTLSQPTGGATLGAQAQVPAIVIDYDDAFPFYRVDDAQSDEPANGTAVMTFTVQLSPSDHAQVVEFFTEDGTAVAGEDYVATQGQFNFPASTETQSETVQVTINADALDEGDEVFYLRLSGPGNVISFDGIGIGTIGAVAVEKPDLMLSDGFED